MTFKVGDPKPAGSGRTAKAPNKVTKQLKEMILCALDDADENGGQAYLTKQAKLNPVAFLALIGKVLPTTLAGDKDNPLVVTVSRINLVPVSPRERS